MLKEKTMRSFALCRINKISSIFLTVAVLLFAAAAAAQTAAPEYLTTTDVHVRKGPGTNYEVVATIPKGVKVNVVGREGAWLKIESKHGNKPGYIHGQYARPMQDQQNAQSKSAVTTVAGSYKTIRETDLREGPGLQYRIAAKLPADIKVNVLRAEGDWLRVESKRGNKPGYVEKRDLERWVDR
jgi:uncharacterized protein YgiM (DUF1202 family)